MADPKTMTPEKIEANHAKVQGWMDNHPELADDEEYVDSIELIELCLRRMIRSPQKAVKNWSQICTEGRDFPEELGWPVRQGKESNLPSHVRTSVALYKADAVADAYTIADTTGILGRTFVNTKNQEIGGMVYSELENGAELYAKSQGTSTSQRFTKLFNDKRWNGHYGEDAVFTQLTIESSDDSDNTGEEE
jgi:hypothetical protein